MEPLVDIRVPDPSLVVLVGAAGSGKSTFAARHFALDEVLASDDFRGRVAGDPTDQGATGPAFAALHRALRRRLRDRRLTVVDATNVTTGARRSLVRAASAAGVPVLAIVLDLPPELVLARNAGRPGQFSVPEPTVRSHLDVLSRAIDTGRLEREGFAAMIRLTTPGAVDAVRIVRVRPAARPGR